MKRLFAFHVVLNAANGKSRLVGGKGANGARGEKEPWVKRVRTRSPTVRNLILKLQFIRVILL